MLHRKRKCRATFLSIFSRPTGGNATYFVSIGTMSVVYQAYQLLKMIICAILSKCRIAKQPAFAQATQTSITIVCFACVYG